MPSISRIRFTNVVYDGGKKRYIDTTFRFDGYNGILLLENGAGKTVFVQTLIQAVLPRKTVLTAENGGKRQSNAGKNKRISSDNVRMSQISLRGGTCPPRKDTVLFAFA